MVLGTDIDAEDSLALDRWDVDGDGAGPVLDVAVIRFPRIANFGDLDPLRLEPSVTVRWVRSAAELGRPHLVVLPGSKATRDDLAWFRGTGLAAAVEAGDAAVVAVCAGLQMCGQVIDDPSGTEGAPGSVAGLGWLPVSTRFEAGKVLDRPVVEVVDGPAAGALGAGYRIHHGRVTPEPAARPWLVPPDGTAVGWWRDRVAGTSLHGLFESDDLRAGLLRWAAARAGVPVPAAARGRIRGGPPGPPRRDRRHPGGPPRPRPAVAHRRRRRPGAGMSAPDTPNFVDLTTPTVVKSTKFGSLAAVTALVGHLRWRVGPPEDGDLVGARLAADPDGLAAQVKATAAGRGSDDPQVLGSLWWQAYAYRVAGTTLAAWVVGGSAPDVSAPGTAVGVARARPSSLVVDPVAGELSDLADVVERLFAGHLDPVAAALKERHSLGTQLLWGDVAAGIASALGAVGTADGAPPLRPRVDLVTAALPHDIGGLGAWAPGRWAFRRRTCCLWWKTTASAGVLCEDCSLR